jgi:hypothetical protein
MDMYHVVYTDSIGNASCRKRRVCGVHWFIAFFWYKAPPRSSLPCSRYDHPQARTLKCFWFLCMLSGIQNCFVSIHDCDQRIMSGRIGTDTSLSAQFYWGGDTIRYVEPNALVLMGVNGPGTCE